MKAICIERFVFLDIGRDKPQYLTNISKHIKIIKNSEEMGAVVSGFNHQEMGRMIIILVERKDCNRFFLSFV